MTTCRLFGLINSADANGIACECAESELVP